MDETPPCADALIEAGIGRVVIALEDPDPRVDGGGIEQLRAAGIAVELACAPGGARDLNPASSNGKRWAARWSRSSGDHPDGRIATPQGESSGSPAGGARTGHLMRAEHDAILVGIETRCLTTIRASTCRLPGLADRSPGARRAGQQSALSARPRGARAPGATARHRLLTMTAQRAQRLPTNPGSRSSRSRATARADPAGGAGGSSPSAGITRVLIEGGAASPAAFLLRTWLTTASPGSARRA